MADRRLTGVLLVGGASRRFGSAKSLAELEGETLADRAWRLLGDACTERFAVGRDIGLSFSTLPDAAFGGGPLAGIVAGLRAATHEVAIVIPVDMPLLTVGALHELADACRDAAVPQSGPLPGAYAKRVLPRLERALERGDLALRHVLEGLDVSTVELDATLLANVNEPEDLERLRGDRGRERPRPRDRPEAPEAEDDGSRKPIASPAVSGVFRIGEEAYDDFMGRYSVRLAPLFADFAGVREGDRVLDVGAGTGALSGELHRRGARVTAVEPSPEFAGSLRRRFEDVHQAPAEDLPFEDGTFDVALAQLVVAFMADAPRGVAEMARVARTVAVCMWGVAEVEMFAAIDRTAKVIGADRAEGGARRYRTPAELRDLLAPLGAVEMAELDVAAGYVGFDEFWSALSRQVGPAGAWLAALDDDQRARAYDEMHRQLGSPSGAFELAGRCYAARVSTDARSAPVPTSDTSTSSSDSTKST